MSHIAKLEVGKTYRSRNGCVSTIKGSDFPDTFIDAEGVVFHADGRSYATHFLDLVEELVKPLRPHGDPSRRGDIGSAYRDLLYLVAEVGREYPDASAKVAVHWGVSTEALGELYDSEQSGS